MPELPEVETVRRSLEKEILHQTLGTPELFVSRLLQTPREEFLQGVPGKEILSLSRRGKYLIVHLSQGKKLVLHLRMEGKLFVVDKERHSTSHLSLFLPFQDSRKGLAFYDVRKFGTCHYLDEKDDAATAKLGKEPFDLDAEELFSLLSKKRRGLKECLLDQEVVAGIGNIYADEILFASRLSPFRAAKDVMVEECRRILLEARRILTLAIARKGSTVKTFQVDSTTHGGMQELLQVYQREGKECLSCHRTKVEKKMFHGRGTHYCPRCQKTGFSIAVTGKIGAGKSLVLQNLRKEGILVLSLDDEVHALYQDPFFLAEARRRFPFLFAPSLDKGRLQERLLSDASFRRLYEHFLYPRLREKVEAFLVSEDGRDKAVEVPLLFDAHFEPLFTFLVGVETTKQKEHLRERGERDVEGRLAFNRLNSYDKNRHRLDYVLTTDSTKRDLKGRVHAMLEEMRKRIDG